MTAQPVELWIQQDFKTALACLERLEGEALKSPNAQDSDGHADVRDNALVVREALRDFITYIGRNAR